jgi:hypothetical protein
MTTQTISNITTRCKRCLKVVIIYNPIVLAAVQAGRRLLCHDCRDQLADDGGRRNGYGK